MQTISLEQEQANYARLTVDVDALANRARRKMHTVATMNVLLDTLPYSSQRSGYKASQECCWQIKRIQYAHRDEIEVVQSIFDCDLFKHKEYQTKKTTSVYHAPHAEILIGNYCKKRYCTVCNNIRSMQAYIKYSPVLNLWEQPYFVTLTVQNVPQNQLISLMDEMQNTWERIKRQFQNEKTRKKLPIPAGLRKLECTYNTERNDYHPHYHIICDSQQAAERIVNAWLNQSPPTLCSPKAQNMKPADPQTIFELFKYFAKSITKKDGDTAIYPVALDAQFTAMSGRRVIQDFNMGQYKTVFGADVKPEKPEGYEFGTYYFFNESVGDWMNADDRQDRLVGVDRGPEILVIKGLDRPIENEIKRMDRWELLKEGLKRQNSW